MVKYMKKIKMKKVISMVMLIMLVSMISIPAFAVNLGTADSFSVLAGSTITNTGTTIIDGDVGLHPGTVFSGQGTATVSGVVHIANAVALQAKNDLLDAYIDAVGQASNTIGAELGGSTLTPGVYNSLDTSFQITGTLTLDGDNDLNPVFIFQAGSALTTASGSKVELINGANSDNIFWQVGSSATLGTNSDFVGNILSSESITATTGAKIKGQLLALNGAVTLDSNTISEETTTPAALHIIKHVVNDNGGTADASDFNLYVKSDGINVSGSPAQGAESPGTTYYLDAGSYTITEDSVAGYTLSYSGHSDGSGNIDLALGDKKTVTLTNNDTEATEATETTTSTRRSTNDNETTEFATLHIIKHVVNDNDGTAVASDFNLYVKSDGIDVAQSPGAESPGTSYELDAGTYTITEESFEGYTVSYSGDSDASGNIDLALGDEKTVTLTNDDNEVNVTTEPATLHIIKHVVNDDDGTAVASDFNLYVKTYGSEVLDVAQDPGAEAPGTTYELDSGIYTITEDSFEGYTLTYSGDIDSSGNIVLAPGVEKTVILINDDNTVIPTSVNTTVEGGQLPDTSTPWYNFLLMGVVLIMASVVGLFKYKKA